MIDTRVFESAKSRRLSSVQLNTLHHYCLHKPFGGFSGGGGGTHQGAGGGRGGPGDAGREVPGVLNQVGREEERESVPV